jgi:hypothetical protein
MAPGGSVIQIAAKGRQDENINGTPEFTLFKTKHQAFTNFAEDFEENEFSSGTVGFGQKVSATINRYGDLVSDVMLEVKLPAIGAPDSFPDPSDLTSPAELDAANKAAYWVNAVGFAIVQEVSLEIGGTEVDTLYSEWLYFWEELVQRPGARLGEQIGKFAYHDAVEDEMIEFAKVDRTLYIPLPFWFNKYFMEKGLCIPLVALTYHEIRIKVTFRSLADVAVVVYKGPNALAETAWLLAPTAYSVPKNVATGISLVNSDISARLLVTYVYLDQDERNAFVEVDHEYLITTLQRQTSSITTAGAVSDQIKLYFNHPCNCLVWHVLPNDWKTNRRRNSVGFQDRFDYSLKSGTAATTGLPWADAVDPIIKVSLTLNGHDRFPDDLPGVFFRVVQPSTKWENIPSGYIYMYTFAMQGGVWNPTSTLNFSRIDHVQLTLGYGASIPASEVTIFVESYNVLLVSAGMGGIKWN